MSEKTAVGAVERWEKLREIRQIFMGFAILFWVLGVAVSLDGGRNLSWNFLTVANIGGIPTGIAWLVTGLMEKKARKIAEGAT